MTANTIVALVATGLGSGGLGVIVAAVLTHIRETRRDRSSAITQHAEHIQQHLEHQEAELTRAREEIAKLWAARRDDAITMRRMGDHIDALEHHIWKGLPPPPPTRPDGI